MYKKTTPLRVLFIGNSATYVHEIPKTLSILANDAGYKLQCDSVVKGGATLTMHADFSSELGDKALQAIKSGYDIIFIQDNGNCISSDTMREASIKAAKTLDLSIRENGAITAIYVRPPYGKDNSGYNAFEQCIEFDGHFNIIANDIGAKNAYVNRAFAYAIKNTDINLWGPDNAHTSEHGAYLAVCVIFATIFHTSATVLGNWELDKKDAKSLQDIADKIAIEGIIPW